MLIRASFCAYLVAAAWRPLLGHAGENYHLELHKAGLLVEGEALLVCAEGQLAGLPDERRVLERSQAEGSQEGGVVKQAQQALEEVGGFEQPVSVPSQILYLWISRLDEILVIHEERSQEHDCSKEVQSF